MIIFLTKRPLSAAHIDLREMYGAGFTMKTSTSGTIEKRDDRHEYGKFAILTPHQIEQGGLLGYETRNSEEPNHLIMLGDVHYKPRDIALKLLGLWPC